MTNISGKKNQPDIAGECWKHLKLVYQNVK